MTSRASASAGTSQSEAWRILQTGEAAAAAAEAETQKIGENPEKIEVTPRDSWNGAARGPQRGVLLRFLERRAVWSPGVRLGFLEESPGERPCCRCGLLGTWIGAKGKKSRISAPMA